MPITEELKNVKKFESVGFSHEQAEVLAETLEKAQVDGHESLKDFIRDEISKLRIEISDQFKDVRSQFKEIHNEINISELRMKASQTDLLVKILGIVVGTVGIAVTILKLFP